MYNFERLLKEVREGDVIVVESIYRFGGTLATFKPCLVCLQEKKVNLISINEPFLPEVSNNMFVDYLTKIIEQKTKDTNSSLNIYLRNKRKEEKEGVIESLKTSIEPDRSY